MTSVAFCTCTDATFYRQTQADRQTERQIATGRQADSQADRQADRYM